MMYPNITVPSSNSEQLENETFTPTNLDAFRMGNVTQCNYLENANGTDYLERYHRFFHAIHPYLSLVICIFGVIANILNTTVFRRNKSPLCILLTGVASADVIFLFSSIPTIVSKLLNGIGYDASLNGILRIIELIFSHLKIICHAVLAWLTVSAGIWRYIAEMDPQQTIRFRNLVKARLAVIITYCTCIVLYVPTFLPLGQEFFDIYCFWIIDVVIITLPSLILLFLALCLVITLCRDKNRRDRLKVRVSYNSRSNNITQMLLVIIFLYLVTHLPHGLVDIIFKFHENDFLCRFEVYLEETMDFLELLNCAVSLTIYSFMNNSLRNSLVGIFSSNCARSKKNDAFVENSSLKTIPIQKGRWRMGCLIYLKE